MLGALGRLGIAYEEDPTLVRGFDYYTMTVFEFTSDRLGAQSAVGGRRPLRRAGRGARRAPDPGDRLRAGIERIVLATAGEGAGDPPRSTATWRCPTAALRPELCRCVERLRAAGLRCESDLRGRSLKSMMRHAAAWARVTR